MIIPEEFKDFYKVMLFGVKKHGANNWLDIDGNKSDFQAMHFCMLHHLGQSAEAGELNVVDMISHLTYGVEQGKKLGRLDHETELDALLHLICRAQMTYVKLIRGHYDE